MIFLDRPIVMAQCCQIPTCFATTIANARVHQVTDFLEIREILFLKQHRSKIDAVTKCTCVTSQKIPSVFTCAQPKPAPATEDGLLNTGNEWIDDNPAYFIILVVVGGLFYCLCVCGIIFMIYRNMSDDDDDNEFDGDLEYYT
jgi:hypothetical protein